MEQVTADPPKSLAIERAPNKRRISIWDYDVEHSVYDHACKAMETRPDYPEIERLWAVINERFIFMKYDFNPKIDNDELYQMDLTELANEAEIDDESTVSHLRTLMGAGCLRAVVFFQEFNYVSIVVAPHMVKK